MKHDNQIVLCPARKAFGAAVEDHDHAVFILVKKPIEALGVGELKFGRDGGESGGEVGVVGEDKGVHWLHYDGLLCVETKLTYLPLSADCRASRDIVSLRCRVCEGLGLHVSWWG